MMAGTRPPLDPEDRLPKRKVYMRRESDNREREVLPVTWQQQECLVIVRRHPGTGETTLAITFTHERRRG